MEQEMARGRWAALAALGLGLAAFGASDARAADGANSAETERKLEDLMRAIEAQSDRLEEQTRALAKERAELERQKAAFEALRNSLTSTSAAAKTETAPAKVVAVPREAPRPEAAVAAGGKADRADVAGAAFAPGAGLVLEGQLASATTEKNRFAASRDDAPATFKDVVRAANAPSLAAQESVGQRPEDEEEQGIDIAVLLDQGGVLTPKGTLVIDPSLDYTHSSVNRFFFGGVEIADAVLIGLFEAREIDRDSVTASAGFRYGLTRQLEVSGRLSWLYRDDRVVSQEVDPITNSPDIFEISGDGVGDLDFGLNYQINKPKGGFPFFVGNLRVKTDTGTGPFEVERDLETGLEEELPTGSGFWTIEPSLTVIYPTDPAVLFMNIGYQYSIEEDVNAFVRDRTTINTAAAPPIVERTQISVGNVDPGDALSVSMGIGIGLNDAVSLSIGYEHTWALATETEQFQRNFENGVLISESRSISRSNDAQVGSLLFGASVNFDDNTGFSVNVAAGLTDDSPDVRVSLRTPLSYKLFD